MKHTVNIWVINPAHLAEVRAAATTPRIVDLVQFCPQSIDMTQSGWLPVGTAEVECRLSTTADYRAAAIASIDAELEQLDIKHAIERNTLREYRAFLLSETNDV